MTTQLISKQFAKSKATLQAALNATPAQVQFMNPTPWSEEYFDGTKVRFGQQFAVVMDPQTRMRFSTVTRKADGSFKVS